MIDDKPCTIEHKCPWGVKPIVGMYSHELHLYATDCICYTVCPRRYWSAKKWKNNGKSKQASTHLPKKEPAMISKELAERIAEQQREIRELRLVIESVRFKDVPLDLPAMQLMVENIDLKLFEIHSLITSKVSL